MNAVTVINASPLPSTIDMAKTVERTFCAKFGDIIPAPEGAERPLEIEPRFYEGYEITLSLTSTASGILVELRVRRQDLPVLPSTVKMVKLVYGAGNGAWRLSHNLPDALYGQLCKGARVPAREPGPLPRERAVHVIQRLVAFCADLPMIVREDEVEISDQEEIPFPLMRARA